LLKGTKRGHEPDSSEKINPHKASNEDMLTEFFKKDEDGKPITFWDSHILEQRIEVYEENKESTLDDIKNILRDGVADFKNFWGGMGESFKERFKKDPPTAVESGIASDSESNSTGENQVDQGNDASSEKLTLENL
jgi:hypothetical protein